MSDTPRTESMQGHRLVAHVPVLFARTLERELNAANADLAQRTAERDEARRDACFARCNPWIPEHHITVAVERGWDCFGAKEAKP